MLAVPSFWIGTMVMVFPSLWWGWSPPIQFTPFSADPLKNLSQMITPAIILGFGLSALTMRLTRTMMLEVLRQDYIRTAWAKGLSEKLVVVRHALRNALIPVVTLIGLQAPLLIGGAVIMEQIFVIPGMGLLLLDAVSQRDYPIITGVFLIVGVAVVLINLLKASGVVTIIAQWIPGVTPESLGGIIAMALPFAAGVAIDWYRNHPDNFIARAVKLINGDKVSDASKAAIAASSGDLPSVGLVRASEIIGRPSAERGAPSHASYASRPR